MSDITPMAAVPSEVNYGRIRANFVAFIADDNGNVLEEVPLEGNVILTPTVGVLRFPSTSPPRTAVIQTLQCPVIGGILYPPGTPLGGPFPSQTGVAAVASDQPAGLPTTVQWTASFSLENTSAQPNPVTFEVPSGGVVDLTTVMPATPTPGTVVVVSTVDRDRAEAAAATATQKATAAAASATAAATSATNAETSATAAQTARDTTLAAAILELRGTGQPGSTTETNNAAVGTYYTDTAGTAGAWRWLKTTAGTGVGRWEVVYGDTGWRSINSLLTNGWAAGTMPLRVRRINTEVTYLFPSMGVTGAAATDSRLLAMPTGFAIYTGGNYGLLGIVKSGSTPTFIEKDFNFLSCSARALINGPLKGLASDAWPTTLPGTPA